MAPLAACAVCTFQIHEIHRTPARSPHCHPRKIALLRSNRMPKIYCAFCIEIPFRLDQCTSTRRTKCSTYIWIKFIFHILHQWAPTGHVAHRERDSQRDFDWKWSSPLCTIEWKLNYKFKGKFAKELQSANAACWTGCRVPGIEAEIYSYRILIQMQVSDSCTWHQRHSGAIYRLKGAEAF